MTSLRLWTNDHTDYVIATDAPAAEYAYAEHLGDREAYAEPEEAEERWEALPDDYALAVWLDADGAIAEIEETGAEPVERTAAETGGLVAELLKVRAKHERARGALDEKIARVDALIADLRAESAE